MREQVEEPAQSEIEDQKNHDSYSSEAGVSEESPLINEEDGAGDEARDLDHSKLSEGREENLETLFEESDEEEEEVEDIDKKSNKEDNNDEEDTDEEENDKVDIKEKQSQKYSDEEGTIEVIFDINGVQRKLSILEGMWSCRAHIITYC